MSASNYPLSWPVGHARAKYRTRSAFGTRYGQVTLAQVLNQLEKNLDLLGAKDRILSTNLPTRLDGSPRYGQGQPPDPGVALYFKLKGKEIVLPCDKWDKVECNTMAIVKHIEALRGLERWGVGTVERAFSGYAALPENGTAPAWYDILRCPHDAPAELIEDRFRLLAKVAHPDVGGNPEKWHELNEARTQGLAAAKDRGQ